MLGCFPPQFSKMDSVRSMDSASSSIDLTVDIDLKKELPTKTTRKASRKGRKPNGKPKRPLSAYNLFFKSEREKLVQAKQRVGFANMAKLISSKWKKLNTEDRKEFVAGAEVEQKKYRSAVKEWKAKHQVEIESHSQQQFAGTSSLDPMVLQRFVIEQQIIEKQNMIQAQLQNAVNYSGGRRMSMPNMGTPLTSTAPMFSIDSYQQLLQHQQQQSQAMTGRRFSIPMNISSAALQAQPVSSSFEFSLQDSYTADLTQSTYAESNDESSLDNETADMLINMPIMDMEEHLKMQAQLREIPSSVTATQRRSSMPMLQSKKLEDSSAPTPIFAGRRLSMPQLSDEMKEMQDLLDMLEDDSPDLYSATNSAA